VLIIKTPIFIIFNPIKDPTHNPPYWSRVDKKNTPSRLREMSYKNKCHKEKTKTRYVLSL